MSQSRLCRLAMLFTESQLARKLNFKDLIDDFASRKAVNQTNHRPVGMIGRVMLSFGLIRSWTFGL